MNRISLFASRYITTNNLPWLIFLFLLAVLLPHTSWAFSQFEPQNGSNLTSIAAALAFESAVAVLT